VVDVETGVKRQYPMDQIERAELAR
jgi:hypothetical protein